MPEMRKQPCILVAAAVKGGRRKRGQVLPLLQMQPYVAAIRLIVSILNIPIFHRRNYNRERPSTDILLPQPGSEKKTQQRNQQEDYRAQDIMRYNDC